MPAIINGRGALLGRGYLAPIERDVAQVHHSLSVALVASLPLIKIDWIIHDRTCSAMNPRPGLRALPIKGGVIPQSRVLGKMMNQQSRNPSQIRCASLHCLRKVLPTFLL